MDAALLLLTLHWLLGGIFVVAFLHKARAWPRFKAALAAYQLLPEALVPAAGVGLGAAEAATLLLLLTWQSAGVLLAMVLLVVYASVIAISVVRGRTHIDCGCGDEPTPVSWALVMRNVCLIVLAVWAWQLHAAGALATSVGWMVGLISLGLGLLAFAIYQAIEQLFANRGRHQRLWQGVS